MYVELARHSLRLMNRQAVRLSAEARRLACRTMVDSLRRHNIEVIALSVDAYHDHILARFPKPTDRNPWACKAPSRKDDNHMLALIRHFVGIAKKDAARALSDAQLTAEGGAWAKR